MDAQLTIAELFSHTELIESFVLRILHEVLGLRKACAHRISHLLTLDQKAQRLQCANSLLAMFQPSGPKRLTDIVTGGESWFSFWQPAVKAQNMVWLGEGDERPHVCKKGFSSRKRMLTIFSTTKNL